MSRPFLRAMAAASLVAVACDIPVNVGSRVAAPAPGPTGAGGGSATCDEGKLSAWRVTLDATSVADPTCWNGGLPADPKLPEETFEVLVMSSQAQLTFAVAGLSPQRLGHAPVITVGEAMSGGATSFDWEENIFEFGGPSGLFQITDTHAVFGFDRLDTLQTAGSLFLASRRQSCWFDGDAGCAFRPDAGCDSLRDAGCDPPQCALVRTFTATQRDVSSAWTTLKTEPLDGARKYLVSLDTGIEANSSSWCSGGQTLQARTVSRPTLRTLEVWQATESVVRVPRHTWNFGEARAIEVASDFLAPPGNAQLRQWEADPAPDAHETRTTLAKLEPNPCGFFRTSPSSRPGPVLQLESSYECVGAGCASARGAEAGTCRVEMPWFAIEVP